MIKHRYSQIRQHSAKSIFLDKNTRKNKYSSLIKVLPIVCFESLILASLLDKYFYSANLPLRKFIDWNDYCCFICLRVFKFLSPICYSFLLSIRIVVKIIINTIMVNLVIYTIYLRLEMLCNFHDRMSSSLRFTDWFGHMNYWKINMIYQNTYQNLLNDNEVHL